jgi:hypothetical protein
MLLEEFNSNWMGAFQSSSCKQVNKLHRQKLERVLNTDIYVSTGKIPPFVPSPSRTTEWRVGRRRFILIEVHAVKFSEEL